MCCKSERRKAALFLAVSLLCYVILSPVYGVESFPLHVNDVSGLDEPWPMLGGIAFPEGALRDTSNVRIVDAAGTEVPAQIDVTATWRDGTVRWALAGIHASPRGEYRVEFGPDIARSEHDRPLRVRGEQEGAFVVDTGEAEYEFRPDRLLPERGRMGETVILDGSGDGAYLIDNHGRLARAAGEVAEIETEFVKEGPGRAVIRRAGWYVTDDGEQVARARMFFYFMAGSPFVRITHLIIFTEDTNELWVRDYGLEFKTTHAPTEAVFCLSESTEADSFMGAEAPEGKSRMLAEMFSSGLYEREQTLFTVQPDGDEVYMLQENYPHVLEREFRAVIARSKSTERRGAPQAKPGNLWVDEWLLDTEVAGDWGEARYNDHALTVVMPQLAQRFPKEIAFGPQGARVAFWSGRSGRELDFRAVTLVNEYWKRWADRGVHAFGLHGSQRGPGIGTKVAQQPSNAQGAARTHEIWLLPRTGAMDEQSTKARALAASHHPLLQTDPQWLGSSKAIGWPMHPKDMEHYPGVEESMTDRWANTLGGRYGNAEVRRTGFLMWGKHITLGTGPRWFRLSRLIDYSFRNSTWFQYMRTGNRRYYDYGRHHNEFAGDLCYAHWTAGNKFRGGFATAQTGMPFHWGYGSEFDTGSVPLLHWPLEYYLTGNEYARELIEMVGYAYREHWDSRRHLSGAVHGHLNNLSILHQLNWDETYNDIARQVAPRFIDLDNPVGLNDDLRYGVYYKISREWLFPLYMYYRATGDEQAREAILRALDDKFRFNHEDLTRTPDGRGPSSTQTYRLFMFSEAYRWTGKTAYLELIKHMLLEYPLFGLMGHNFYQGAPVAQYLLAQAEEPVDTFPVLAATRDPDHNLRLNFEFIDSDTLPPIRIRKDDEAQPLRLSIYVRMPNDMDEDTEPEPVVSRSFPDGNISGFDGVQIEKQQAFKTKNVGRRDLRRWHLGLTLPPDAGAGDYLIEFPRASTFTVLESDASEIELNN